MAPDESGKGFCGSVRSHAASGCGSFLRVGTSASNPLAGAASQSAKWRRGVGAQTALETKSTARQRFPCR
ncbi:predicted protein [Chaetomium globosum CBS 148.51]|uniref:Uncharacterized protein n=1 Tax=Chaetomium globosum (strain ATCC 6205 / CBS 148.51 / DSM 1962 / NBRC 6347 / NRRL 1970) TaxID=306901 RepID=Q2GTW2_CHAGB|nr:uncharacterized protein CHGG_08592 [Chaetomium globosum CBS 148.51]EAQ84578.1 predicted protein [Chaetomium globosum CBS 148.51]